MIGIKTLAIIISNLIGRGKKKKTTRGLIPLEIKDSKLKLKRWVQSHLIYTLLLEIMINSRNYTRNKCSLKTLENPNVKPSEEENWWTMPVYDVKIM